jgi:hypothetical protein
MPSSGQDRCTSHRQPDGSRGRCVSRRCPGQLRAYRFSREPGSCRDAGISSQASSGAWRSLPPGALGRTAAGSGSSTTLTRLQLHGRRHRVKWLKAGFRGITYAPLGSRMGSCAGVSVTNRSCRRDAASHWHCCPRTSTGRNWAEGRTVSESPLAVGRPLCRRGPTRRILLPRGSSTGAPRAWVHNRPVLNGMQGYGGQAQGCFKIRSATSAVRRSAPDGGRPPRAPQAAARGSARAEPGAARPTGAGAVAPPQRVFLEALGQVRGGLGSPTGGTCLTSARPKWCRMRGGGRTLPLDRGGCLRPPPAESPRRSAPPTFPEPRVNGIALWPRRTARATRSSQSGVVVALAPCATRP